MIHLFPCLSGGHHPKAGSASVPPWDHLRKNEARGYLPGYLNKLRKHEYLKAFEDNLEILEIHGTYEGEDLLTPEILSELSDFSKEELLQRELWIIARK